MSLCPKCSHLSVEFDRHQKVERCLNRKCDWVNRKGVTPSAESAKFPSFKFSRTMATRVRANSAKEVRT